jgi:5'-3' exonuclease
MTRTVLIDGDILAYRCGFAAEHKLYNLSFVMDDPHTVTHHAEFTGKRAMNEFLKEHEDEITEYEWESRLEVEPIAHCLSTVKHMIENIRKDVNADKVNIYLSSKTNFRDGIATIQKYKGNRDQRRKPIHHEEIVKYLRKYCNAVTLANLEADDVLADVQTSCNKAGDETVIASNDKDLLQIPGLHYDFVKKKKMRITPESGMRRLYCQMLTGDRTDNIPGIYKVGPVTAEEILAEASTEEEYEAAVYTAWDNYLTSDNTPEWLVAYNGMNSIWYRDWKGDAVETELTTVLDELKRLLTVGIPNGTSEEDDS